jgi:hypothetical protein
MNPRERILAILNRQPVDRVPVELWYTPEIAGALRNRFGVQDDFITGQALGLDKIVCDFMDYKTGGGGRMRGFPPNNGVFWGGGSQPTTLLPNHWNEIFNFGYSFHSPSTSWEKATSG